MVRFGATAVVTALVVACSGQTLEGDPFYRGMGGATGIGGTTGGGTAAGAGGATGGSMSGGAGGASGGTGGATSGTGGMPMTGGTGGMPGAGGTPMTGGSGGMPMMGGTTATGGSGGEAGAGICELPLVSGSCQALFYTYGFDVSLGHCVLFPYGGCGGNENRFETLGECETACGGSMAADCPDEQPQGGLECEPLDHPCHYSFIDGCLCVPTNDSFGCDKVDPNCPQTLRECIGEDCVGRIIAATRNRCACTEGAWACLPE